MAGIRLGWVEIEDVLVDPLHQLVTLLQRRSFLIQWRHDMRVQHLAHVVPVLHVRPQGRVVLVLIHGELALLHPVGMAVVAILLEQRQHLLLIAVLPTHCVGGDAGTS